MVMTLKPVKPIYDSGDGRNILKPRVYPDVMDNPVFLNKAMELQEMGLMGLWITIGYAGSGKDTFAHYISFLQRHLFVDREVAIDSPPKPLFDKYSANRDKPYKLIDYNQIREIIRIQRSILKKRKKVNQELDPLDIEDIDQQLEIEEKTDEALRVDEWANWLFPYTTCVFSEYWKWFKKRDAFNPIGQFLAGIHRTFRHQGTLIIGIAQKWNELDVYSVQEHITAKVICAWTGEVVRAKFFTKKSITENGVLNFGGVSRIVKIHPKQPVSLLDGLTWFDIYNSFNKQSLLTR